MTESAAASYPERVREAMDRAAAAAFELSSEPAVGRAIMTLAAAVRQGGRILEIGTGLGVGTAWLVEGLETRPDVELVTIECDPQRAALAAQANWPASVTPVLGDVVVELPALGSFSLIFADAANSKHLPKSCAKTAARILWPGASGVKRRFGRRFRNWVILRLR